MSVPLDLQQQFELTKIDTFHTLGLIVSRVKKLRVVRSYLILKTEKEIERLRFDGDTLDKTPQETGRC